MPEAAPPRSEEPLGDDLGGRRVLAQQEGANVRVADIGVVHGLDQRAGNSRGGFRKADQPVDGLGELRGAARAVPHLAFDETRVDGAGAHHAGDGFTDRTRTRARRIGRVECNQIGAAAKCGEERKLMKGTLKGVVVGSICSMVVLLTATAVAGTGVGGVFNLGQENTVNAQTSLKGSVSSNAQLRVEIERSRALRNQLEWQGRVRQAHSRDRRGARRPG